MSNAGNIERRTRRLGSILLAGITMSLIGASPSSDPLKSRLMAQGLQGEFGLGDTARTLAYLDKLDFVISPTAESVYVGKFQCASCTGDSIRLMFVPEKNAHNVNWTTAEAKGGPGEVIAMVINMDTKPLPELGLAPQGVAYAWVGQIGANDRRGFGIYRLYKNGKRAGSWWVSTDVKQCKDNQRTRPSIKAAHPKSGPSAPAPVCTKLGSVATTSGITSLASTSLLPLMPPPTNGGSLWVSCSGGCCQVGPS